MQTPAVLDSLQSELHSLVSQMTTTQWLIATAIGFLLFVAIVKQLLKTALVAVILLGIGLLLVHGQSANWSFAF